MRQSDQALEAFATALKQNVCSRCCQGGYEDACRIGEDGRCPIEMHLRALVEAVLSTPRSPRVADYLPGVRRSVCAHCERQDEHGVCRARDLSECGLDSFAVDVVATIEEVQDELTATES